LYRAAIPIWDATPAAVQASRADVDTAQREMRAVLKRLAFDIGLKGAQW
jgi:hypothetical protein